MLPATVTQAPVVTPHHIEKNENLTDDERGQILRSCQHFESLLVNIMFTTMRQTIADGGLVEKSNAEEIFTSFLDTEYSKLASTSSNNGVGLAGMMYEQLTEESVDKVPPMPHVSEFDSRLNFGLSAAPTRTEAASSATQPVIDPRRLEDFYFSAQ
ncbi:rod-binding protein [Desulfurispira natronophila]|uniref:Flagellar protein FlgJ n=1 Tax=Desulfurispira natronophila TaxID=682562 RepID=A0A7W8DHQ4_9BACT|nr:rod-binding protein [Desulfurispira natronophila]MBB5022725.1 flagellar protein FlgJ [Desulfurispira natronophila]